MVGWMAGSDRWEVEPSDDGREEVSTPVRRWTYRTMLTIRRVAAGKDHQAVAGDVEEPIYLKLLRSWKVL